MAKECMLTTVDNPFNPFDDFDKWYLFDIEHHYATCERLGSIARTSNDLSEEDNHSNIEKAIDLIIANDYLDLYRKVVKES